MFSPDFYPTPHNVIEMMLQGHSIEGKVILEPSAGKGDIVDYCTGAGAATVIACENNPDLKRILASKCSIIADDFLTVESHQVSHVDMIIMNPPFTADEKHILHAFEIAPAGCTIIALCNLNTVKNNYTEHRKRLKQLINENGGYRDLKQCFEDSERRTSVEIALITMVKPGESYKSEFEGFFMEEEQEEQENGIMSYNVVRDLVNRYVGAIKIYDEQLAAGVKMNQLTSGFFSSGMGINISQDQKPIQRNEFKKAMQKSGWNFIFEKMNMQKYATRGLRNDINKFVEQQQDIPFTMKNIYHMLQIVVGTTEQRMDKAMLEAFDNITKHHDDNRYNIEGWKTNSHFLLTKKFIVPYMVDDAYRYGSNYATYQAYRSGGRYDIIEDLEKAICFNEGKDWSQIKNLNSVVNNNNYGEWYEDHEFFRFKAFKKGTMHFQFKDEELWARFNQKIAKLKGYPLYEGKKQTAYQDRQTGRETPKPTQAKTAQAKILFEIKVPAA